MKNENCVLLSICIPTYNRLFKLRQQIEDLQTVADDRFNVIVWDNNSNDGTKEYLASIKDLRFHCVSHESVSSAKNITDALMEANTDFALLLLDKDSIDAQLLPRLLDVLQETTARYGLCSLANIYRVSSNSDVDYLELSYESFIKMAYTCRHPSGFFYKTETMKELIAGCKYLIEEEFPFIFDVVNAHFAAESDALIVNFPVVFAETDDEGVTTKSYTYNIDNLWFAPQKVVHRYSCFTNDLISLPFPDNLKSKARTKLAQRCYYYGTVGYSSYLSNDKICAHYGIQPRRIKLFEKLKLSFEVSSLMKEQSYHISLWMRMLLCIGSLAYTISYNLKKSI